MIAQKVAIALELRWMLECLEESRREEVENEVAVGSRRFEVVCRPGSVSFPTKNPEVAETRPRLSRFSWREMLLGFGPR